MVAEGGIVLAEELGRTRGSLLRLVDAVAPERWAWRPREGAPSMLEALDRLARFEEWLAERLHALITHPDLKWQHFRPPETPPDDAGRFLRHAEVLGRLSRAHHQVVKTLVGLDDELLARAGWDSEWGRVTVADLARRFAQEERAAIGTIATLLDEVGTGGAEQTVPPS